MATLERHSSGRLSRILAFTFCVGLAAGNILQYDSLPVNEQGTWMGDSQQTNGTRLLYRCLDSTTNAGIETCLTAILSPIGVDGNVVNITLKYESPQLKQADGSTETLVRKDNTGVKVKTGDKVPQISHDQDQSGDWNGILVATDFAQASNTSRTALEMMLVQVVVANGFEARALPFFTYSNDGILDDDGCLGEAGNQTNEANWQTIADKCPNPRTLPSGSYKYMFFAYQRTTCSGCKIILRNKVVASASISNIAFNGDKTLDTIGSAQINKISFSGSTVSSTSNSTYVVEVDLDSNSNSGRKPIQVADPNGAVITVSKIDSTSFYLNFEVAAPGQDLWVSYDPTATSKVITTSSEEESDLSSSSHLSISSLPLQLFCSALVIVALGFSA